MERGVACNLLILKVKENAWSCVILDLIFLRINIIYRFYFWYFVDNVSFCYILNEHAISCTIRNVTCSSYKRISNYFIFRMLYAVKDKN